MKWEDAEHKVRQAAAVYVGKSQGRLDFDELMNIVWLSGRIARCNDVRHVYRQSEYAIIDYLRANTGYNRTKRRRNLSFASLTRANVADGEEHEVLDPRKGHVDRIERNDFITYLLSDLPGRLGLIMRMRFDGLTLDEIGKALGYTESAMSYDVQNALVLLQQKVKREGLQWVA